MEPVFRALADPTRRELLDELFRRDGQSLSALAGRFDMTRVAVAKHLRLLEDAGLIVSDRRGREKLHFLNPVPIRLLHDRWVSKYTQPWVAGLVDLQRELEDDMEKVFEIFIRTTPERLWQAITDPVIRERFQFGSRIDSDWTLGSRYRVTHAGASRDLVDGTNLEIDPPRRLVQTYHAVWDDDVAARGTSRVTWEIEPVADSCRLLVRHDQLPADADEHLYGGWPMILSGLKTWLETGSELTTPGSLMYAAPRHAQRLTHGQKDVTMPVSTSVLHGVRTVSVPVDDQQCALEFYTRTLGFSVVRDAPTPNGRWIEIAPGGGTVVLTLDPAAPGVTRAQIMIRFAADDARLAHDTLTAAGVDTDDILEWPGVPPMFAFRDPDGNAFSVTQV